jgi:hypothetical protein
MDKINQILRFVRIIDSEGNISLSNIAMVTTLARLLLMPATTVPDLLAFLGTVANYSIRRAITQQPVDRADEVAMLKDAVASLQTKVTTLQLKQ